MDRARGDRAAVPAVRDGPDRADPGRPGDHRRSAPHEHRAALDRRHLRLPHRGLPDHERAGAAAGISETGSEIGGALGLALLGTVGTAVYRGQAAESLSDDLPSGAAGAASDTLGGAVEVAGGLPHVLAADVLAAARDAFAQSLEVAATVSGVLVVAAAILVARLLMRGEEPEAPAEPVAAPVAVAVESGCA
jgi:DHA2 family multidrug resistance protein-like MFS transporter